MKIVMLLTLTVCCVVVAIVHSAAVEPKSMTDEESHWAMKAFLKDHPFAVGYPTFLNKHFIGKLVRNPSGFLLPPGQLWPYPTSWWTIKPSALAKFLWPYWVWWTTGTKYSATLFMYRLPNAGIGYLDNINPGGHKGNEDLKLSLEAAGKRDTPEWRQETFLAATSLFHSGQDDRKLVTLLEELCHETTLTPQRCDDPEAKDAWKAMIRNLLMFSYIRMGENDNCRANHSHQSCLLPLQGLAIHQHPYGSQNAIKYLEVELKSRPENIGTKWLLNVVHMTLGSYPEGVPEQWRMDPTLFQSEYDIKTFPNVAELLGMDTYTSKGTGIMDDFVGQDGLKDIFQCSTTYNRNVKLYKNNGDGSFTDVTEKAGLLGIDGGSNCRHTDYNNDGHLDIFMVRGGWFKIDHVNSILRNNGDGTFTDVTYKAGVSSRGASHTLDFADIDRDGKLDYFVANEDIACEMWLNKGGDSFENVADKDIQNCGLVKGMVFTDYNDDSWPDIYLSRYGFKNILLRNDGKMSATEPGKWSFTDVTEEVGLGDPLFSFPVASFDADQDGSLDLLVTGHLFEGPDAICSSYTNESYFVKTLHTPSNPEFGSSPDQKLTRLFLNKGGKFVDVSESAGLRRHVMTMSVNYGDLDNDGNLDIYFGTGQPEIRAIQPNRMYRNNGNNYFQDVTTSGNFGHLQKGHGISFADLDNDGDLDIYSQLGGAYYGDFFQDAMYLNPGHNNHFIKIDLVGTETNRKGVGCRIFVHTLDDAGKRKVLHHIVSPGGSYGSNALEAHIGLTQAVSVEKVVVWWQKTGKKQEVVGMSLDSKIRITEGTDGFEIVVEPSFVIDTTKLGQKSSEPTCHGHH